MECSLAGCGRQSVAFDPFSSIELEIPTTKVWLEPFLLPIYGTPVRVGLWISKQATISELIDEVCSLVDDLIEGKNGEPLKPSDMYVASTDMDGKHIKRRLGKDWQIVDIHLKYPLWVLEVPHVLCCDVEGDQRLSDEIEGELGWEKEEARTSKLVPYKIVHRVKSEAYHYDYELIGTPFLIYIDKDASSMDVVEESCILSTKCSAELLLAAIRKNGVKFYANQENVKEDEDYEMIGDEREDEEVEILMQQPWLVLLKSGLCKMRCVQGSKRDILRVEEGTEIPIDNCSLASEYIISPHSTICFDWSPHVTESLVDLSLPENCIMHPSFTMESEIISSFSDENDVDDRRTELKTSAQGKETSVTLSNCLDRYTSTESLPEHRCERCQKSTYSKCSKKLSFTRLPRVLLISFKRFKDIHAKDETLVSFPLRGLDMSRWNEGGNASESYLYDLVAVLNHSGKLGYGHYTAYGLTKQGSWALYDDENVTIVSQSKSEKYNDDVLFVSGDDETSAEFLQLSDILVSRQAYLLVYVQRGI